jgi:hypothetical protein
MIMKKILGVILLIIVGLNCVTLCVRASSGNPLGSPGYFIILVLLLIGGIALLISSKKKSEGDSANQNNKQIQK